MTFSRIDRVQNLLKEEIGKIVDRELENPNLPPFITIYGVKLSRDLHYATVLVTFLADVSPEVIEKTVEELNRSAGFIGRLVAQRVKLRRHPHLRFAYNASTRYALDMERIFQEIGSEPKTEEDGDNSGESDSP